MLGMREGEDCKRVSSGNAVNEKSILAEGEIKCWATEQAYSRLVN